MKLLLNVYFERDEATEGYFGFNHIWTKYGLLEDNRAVWFEAKYLVDESENIPKEITVITQYRDSPRKETIVPVVVDSYERFKYNRFFYVFRGLVSEQEIMRI